MCSSTLFLCLEKLAKSEKAAARPFWSAVFLHANNYTSYMGCERCRMDRMPLHSGPLSGKNVKIFFFHLVKHNNFSFFFNFCRIFFKWKSKIFPLCPSCFHAPQKYFNIGNVIQFYGNVLANVKHSVFWSGPFQHSGPGNEPDLPEHVPGASWYVCVSVCSCNYTCTGNFNATCNLLPRNRVLCGQDDSIPAPLHRTEWFWTETTTFGRRIGCLVIHQVGMFYWP